MQIKKPAENKRRMRRNVIPVGLMLLLTFLLVSCSLVSQTLQGNQTNGGSAQQELLIPVTRGSVSSAISFVGNLQYKQSSVMNWKTDGVIEKVYVKVGDTVKKGDVLAELAADSLSSTVLLSEKNMIEQSEKLEDVKDSTSARMQAYVTLNAKESALQKAKLEQEALYYPRATREEMERAWDKYALAHLNFNYAKQDYDFLVSINEPWEGYEPPRYWRGRKISGGDSRSGRQRKFEDYVNNYNELVSAYEKYVWTTGRPTDTEYAVAQGNVAVAQMEYDKALENYLSYGQIPREKDVKQIEISLDTAEAVYNSRFILSPFDGVVTSVSAVEDYYVKKGAEALRVDDLSSIYVPLNIPELDVSTLKLNTPVNISIDAVSGKTYNGHLYAIADSSTASGNTTTFSALVQIDDPDDRLRAGLTAEVSLELGEKKNVLLVPDNAVFYQDGAPYVTVVNGEEHHNLKVTTGVIADGLTELTSGDVREGDLLAVSSVTPDVLAALGLDPSVYLSGNNAWMMRNRENNQSADVPAIIYENRTAVTERPVVEPEPTDEAVLPAEKEADENIPAPETENIPEMPGKDFAEGFENKGLPERPQPPGAGFTDMNLADRPQRPEGRPERSGGN